MSLCLSRPATHTADTLPLSHMPHTSTTRFNRRYSRNKDITLFSTTPRTHAPKCLISPSAHSVPPTRLCFVRCFSPLALPAEVFVYLLQFLNPGDRWRLCQVSHGMCSRVTQCLSRVQRIEHEAVRVLHQEHANASLIPVSPKPTSPSPSPFPSPKTSPLPKTPIQTRSEYWLAQANLLVSIFVAGTTFDFAKVPPTNITTEKLLERALASMEVTSPEVKGPQECIVLDQLVLDRLHSVTNILYDHHLTKLEHRRAIINCARYVSARVDEILGVQDSVFDYSTLRAYTVNLGPYLVVTSRQQEDEFDQEHQNDIPPPTRLSSAFQVMLWHRCMSDLVALYSSIQSRHVNDKKSVPKRSRSMPTLSAPHATTTHKHDQGEKAAYPFCCSAHSLVFTPSCRTINIRELARRTVQVLRNVSLKSFWTPEPEEDPARRNIQPVVGSKLRFCHQEPQQQDRSPQKRPFLQKGPPRRQSDSGLETIGRRNQLHQLRKQTGDSDSRATIEDRSRLDTLKKQELLSLCHMACGLFLADREPETGPSLAALLRSGSPWSKGVWREGEWHKSPIADQKEDHLYSSPSHNSSQSSGRPVGSGKRIRAKLGGIFSLTKSRQDDDDESDGQGRWQRLCLAAIRLLAHEELSWGGNKRNVELSHLKTANRSDAWAYHS